MKKLVMIGCGGIGQYHLEHFYQFKDIELAGFCDLILERADLFAERTGGKSYQDFRTMYDEIEPDMVFICVPPSAHGEIEMETIKRKIPFFVEKPIALDYKLAKSINEAVKQANLITAVGFQCRYSNLVLPTRTFISQNETPMVQCSRISSIPDIPWWSRKETSGGQIVEQTIHQFDLIRYLMGEPVKVFTMGTRGFVKDRPDYDVEDLTVTAAAFTSGSLASIATGCYAEDSEAFDSKITFGSSKARIDHYLLTKVNLYGNLSYLNGKTQTENEAGLIYKGDGALSLSANTAVQTIADDGQAGITCDRTFIDAVLCADGSKILSPYADALKTLAFVLACNQSIESGQPIKIDQMF